MTALNALDNKVPAVQIQGDASVAAVPAFAFLGKRAKNCGLGHSRISQSIGNRPVIMGGPVVVGASDIEPFSAEGAFSLLVYLVMGAGVAAVAHAVRPIFMGMRHRVDGFIVTRLIYKIGIQKVAAVCVIGKGRAVYQHTRQGAAFVIIIKGTVSAEAFGVFKDTAADLDGAIAAFRPRHTGRVGAALDIYAAFASHGNAHRRAEVGMARAAGTGAGVLQSHVGRAGDDHQIGLGAAGKGVAVPVDVEGAAVNIDTAAAGMGHVLQQAHRRAGQGLGLVDR